MKYRSIRFAVCVVVAVLSAACSSPNSVSPNHGGGSGTASPTSSGSNGGGGTGSGSGSAGSGANSGAGSGASATPETDGGKNDAAGANDAGGSDTQPPSSSTGGLPGAVIGGIDYNTACDGPVNKVAMGGYGLAAPVSETNGVGGDTVKPLVAYPAALQVGGDLTSPTKLVQVSLNSNNNTALVANTVYTTTGVQNIPSLTVQWKEGQPPCVDDLGQASLKNFVTVPDPSSSTGLAVGNQSMTWTQHCKINNQTVAGAGCVNIVGGTDAGP